MKVSVSKATPIFLPIAAILCVVGVAGHRYWIRTPLYSLSTVTAAFSEHDKNLFQKSVDVESVVSGILDGAVRRPTVAGTFRTPRIESVDPIDKRMLEKVKPELVRIAKKEILSYVETGKLPESSELKSAPEKISKLIELFASMSHFKDIHILNETGTTANAELGLLMDDKTVFHLKIRLRKTDDHWQIVQIPNFNELAAKKDNKTSLQSE